MLYADDSIMFAGERCQSTRLKCGHHLPTNSHRCSCEDASGGVERFNTAGKKRMGTGGKEERNRHTSYILISLTEDPNAFGSASNNGVESYQLFQTYLFPFLIKNQII